MSMLICVDMDECSLDIHMCDSHADCMNTIGDYYCVCNSGYSGDGYHCSGNLMLMCISHTSHVHTSHVHTSHVHTSHVHTSHVHTVHVHTSHVHSSHLVKLYLVS